MLTCIKCGQNNRDDSANFCPSCGTAYPLDQKKPYVGVFKKRGNFRITFDPVVGEFDHEDEAIDAARHSSWNEDSEFGEYKVEILESTVTPDTHPYICGECGDYVTDNPSGKCSGCNSTNWVKRVSEKS